MLDIIYEILDTVKTLFNVNKDMLDMELVDELLHYIPEIPEDNYLEISQFDLLPSDNVEAYQYASESNNNHEFEKSENSEGKSYPSSVDMCSNNKEKDAEVNLPAQKYKAKRGRPPSKAPTREVVRKRRKVRYFNGLGCMKAAKIDYVLNIHFIAGC